MFPMDPASPWVVQSVNARGEGPTHGAAVAAWYKDYETKNPDVAVGHIQYRPTSATSWSWFYKADQGVWLMADGTTIAATDWPLLANALGSKDGRILLNKVTVSADWQAQWRAKEPSRDSLQP